MTKRKNNIGGLLDNLKGESVDLTPVISDTSSVKEDVISNPAIGLAINATVKRAESVKEPVLHLSHDQLKIFKYHDRHDSSIETVKVARIKKSIESEGQIFPGVVRKTNDVTSDGRMIYEIIAGRLRYEASRSVGVFKAFLKDLDDSEAVTIMISENEDRLDITPFERWLSVLPLVEDEVMESREIASLINWDPGNLSRSLQARPLYEDCNLKSYLLDVSKVALSSLMELAKLYNDDKVSTVKAIAFIDETYPSRKNNLFLKSVIRKVKDVIVTSNETLFLSGSKVKIKKTGESVTLSFKGLPRESEFSTIIDELKRLNALR